MMLLLTRAALHAIGQHAVLDFPAETVGLLVGAVGGPVSGAHRLVNEEARYPGIGYRVGAAALGAARRKLAADGSTVLGVYHSHCDQPASFSPVDRSGAAPGVVHVIVAVHGSTLDGSARESPGASCGIAEVRAWVRSDDGPEREVAIEVIP